MVTLKVTDLDDVIVDLRQDYNDQQDVEGGDCCLITYQLLQNVAIDIHLIFRHRTTIM